MNKTILPFSIVLYCFVLTTNKYIENRHMFLQNLVWLAAWERWELLAKGIR